MPDQPTITVFMSHQSARGTCEQCGHYGPVSLWQSTAAGDHNATLCPPCYGTHLDDARRRYTVRFE